MVTAQSGGGEEEEGAIADPSTDLLDNSHDKLKVSTLIIHSTQYVHWSFMCSTNTLAINFSMISC